LIFSGSEFEDLYIPPRMASGYFQGDKVRVRITPQGEVLNISVMGHRFVEIVGQVLVGQSKLGKPKIHVVYESKKVQERIPIIDPPDTLHDNDWVRVKLIFHSNHKEPVSGKVVEVYGDYI